MKRLVWSSGALLDIERLGDFIRLQNPDAGRRAIVAIRANLKLLVRTPNIGRPVVIEGVAFREKVIVFGSGTYVARYRVSDGKVIILALRHGRE